MNQPDARQIEKRVLPSSDWGHAPADVRAMAEEDPSRALAYDLTFGWCVLQRGGDEPQVLYVQKSPQGE